MVKSLNNDLILRMMAQGIFHIPEISGAAHFVIAGFKNKAIFSLFWAILHFFNWKKNNILFLSFY